MKKLLVVLLAALLLAGCDGQWNCVYEGTDSAFCRDSNSGSYIRIIPAR